MNNYGVGDILQSMRTNDAMEGYTNMVVDQIDNGEFRDMYMDTMESHINGEEIASGEDDVDSAMEAGFGSDMDDIMLGLPPVEEGKCCECGDSGCGGCGTKEDTAYFRSLNSIPESDPIDAGTFFNLKDQKSAVESVDAETVHHLIDTLPETEIAVPTESTAPEPSNDAEVNESAEPDLDILGIGLDLDI